MTENAICNDVAKKNKHFRKRKHILNDEAAFLYDDDDEELGDNFIKRDVYTEVNDKNFASWLISFRTEMRIKQERDPAFLRKKALMQKPSGRMIFDDRSKELLTYLDDGKNEDDDEEIDLKNEMENAEEEDIDIDEGVFGDEDDLDDEDFVIDDN